MKISKYREIQPKKRKPKEQAELPEKRPPVEEVNEDEEEDEGDEHLLYNEFGAPDPGGLPADEVFADEPAAVRGGVALAPSRWENIELEIQNGVASDRRGSALPGMLPKFTGKQSDAKKVSAKVVKDENALDYLLLYLTPNILDSFITSTNLYAEERKTPNWKPLNVKTLIYFIILIIFMGIVKLPSRENYWQKETTGRYGQSLPKKLMSARQFEAIISNLHYTFVPAAQKEVAKAADPFYLVAGLTEAISANSMKYFNLGQFIDIDEMTIYFKGRHKCNVCVV